MKDRELLEKVEEEILDVAQSLIRYNGHADKKGSEYADGWQDAIDQITLELLGRKEQDGAQLLEQTIKGAPSSTKEVEAFNEQ